MARTEFRRLGGLRSSVRDWDSVDGLILKWREAAERRPVMGPFDPGDYRLPDARGPVEGTGSHDLLAGEA